MTDRDALHKAICENPDEDTPRLAFADFLQEQGETERAEFIRDQLALAIGARTPDLKRWYDLVRRRAADWFPGVPAHAIRHDKPNWFGARFGHSGKGIT